MKGMILTGKERGGFYPLTLAAAKSQLSLFDKPLIYYSLAVLMQAGIRDVLVICNIQDISGYQLMFEDGARLGMSIHYAVRENCQGIAEAFLIGEHFIKDQSVALILGDHIVHGPHLTSMLRSYAQLQQGAVIFGYEVKDPERYSVLMLDSDHRVTGVVEKPFVAPSPYAVAGLYFCDSTVIEKARLLKPSHRGELEISDIHMNYLQQKQLEIRFLDKGVTWLDIETPEDLQRAASYVQIIQERQGIHIACLEEIALEQRWITLDQVEKEVEKSGHSSYGNYLKALCLRVRSSPKFTPPISAPSEIFETVS